MYRPQVSRLTFLLQKIAWSLCFETDLCIVEQANCVSRRLSALESLVDYSHKWNGILIHKYMLEFDANVNMSHKIFRMTAEIKKKMTECTDMWEYITKTL